MFEHGPFLPLLGMEWTSNVLLEIFRRKQLRASEAHESALRAAVNEFTDELRGLPSVIELGFLVDMDSGEDMLLPTLTLGVRCTYQNQAFRRS